MKFFVFSVAVIVLAGCGNQTEEKAADQTVQTVNAITDISGYTGSYVSDDYARRSEGYDWVSVSVSQLSDSSLHIRVRSRMDKKKPTCTFDADAIRSSNNQFKSTVDGKSVIYTFGNDSIHIAPGPNEDKDILQYYCSGGGNFGGSYKKISEPLDEKQIDQRVFLKTLSMQQIGFEVSTTGGGSIQELTIKPFGLKIDNSTIKIEVDGFVTKAEIEDLNSDGFPELLVYTASAGSGGYGNVIGYSVNNGKSMSSIYFPPVSENPKASIGYMGHDEFAIVETNLVQRFRIYNEGDSNSSPTGNIRQIQYKLVNGEAGRKFVIDKIVEIPL